MLYWHWRQHRCADVKLVYSCLSYVAGRRWFVWPQNPARTGAGCTGRRRRGPGRPVWRDVGPGAGR